MDKLNMKTANIADENFKKLSAMFPNAVTETITGYDEEGNAIIEHCIDKDILMQEINCKVVDGKEERYQFTWPDKRKAILAANSPISETLRPCKEESVGKDGTLGGFDSENLYIEGDNLDILKLLQETYLGKIKMIYIDPPYNTGNDFIYEDDFRETTEEYLENSGQYDKDGNRLVQNTESNGRFHTDWLNMIYPRLKLARNLLTDDGVIFISIDDNEQSNLVKICNELFGEGNLVADISWQRTYSPRNDSKGISDEKEHLIVFSKKIDWIPNKLPRTEKMDAKYKNPDNDDYPWRTSDAFAPNAKTHQGMVYAIQNPFTGKMIYPYKGACWPLKQSDMLAAMQEWANYKLEDLHDEKERADVCGILKEEVRKNVMSIVLNESIETSKEKANAIIKRGKWPRFFFTKNGEGGIARKTYLKDTDGRVVTNCWSYEEVGHTDEAKKELKALFDGEAPFDTPKPTRLIDRILHISTDKDSIVMDFFSGSATTAHAIFLKNLEDSGKRKFILVQLPEESHSPKYKNLCEIGKERIRRAGAKIREENALTTGDLDTGFRVLKLDSTNMKDVYYNPEEVTQFTLDGLVDNIKGDRTNEDLLFQTMLELGVPLSSKITEEKINGVTVYNVGEENFLIATYDSGVTDEIVTKIAKKQPYYFVVRDSSMDNDAVAANFEQIFKTYSPDTKRKVL